FIWFHGKRHPVDMGPNEVEAFLTDLAVARGVAASTQNQAKSALLFLYKEVLGIELPWLERIDRGEGADAPAGCSHSRRGCSSTRPTAWRPRAHRPPALRHGYAHHG